MRTNDVYAACGIIVIANHRIRSIDNGHVCFTYLDNRIKDQRVEKTMRMDAEEFIRRFLSHVPPPRFRHVRYYGLFANSQRKDNLTRCRELLGLSDPSQPYIADIDTFLAKQGVDPSLCPLCNHGHLRTVYTVLSFHDPPECYRHAH